MARYFLTYCHNWLKRGFWIQAVVWWEPEWVAKTDLTNPTIHLAPRFFFIINATCLLYVVRCPQPIVPPKKKVCVVSSSKYTSMVSIQFFELNHIPRLFSLKFHLFLFIFFLLFSILSWSLPSSLLRFCLPFYLKNLIYPSLVYHLDPFMIFCVFLTLETLLQFPVLSVSKSFNVLRLVLFTPPLTDACCVFSLQLSGLTGCVFPGWILSPSTSLLGGVSSSDIYLVFLECVVLLLVLSLFDAVNGCLGVVLGPGFLSSWSTDAAFLLLVFPSAWDKATFIPWPPTWLPRFSIHIKST